MYDAVIVKDTIPEKLYDQDLPNQHVFLLIDWQPDASIDLFYSIGTSLRYWQTQDNP